MKPTLPGAVHLTDEARIDLIDEVYHRALSATESFEEQSIGVTLAYLFGEIACDGYIECDLNIDCDELFIVFMKSLFDGGHDVWLFISIIEPTEENT